MALGLMSAQTIAGVSMPAAWWPREFHFTLGLAFLLLAPLNHHQTARHSLRDRVPGLKRGRPNRVFLTGLALFSCLVIFAQFAAGWAVRFGPMRRQALGAFSTALCVVTGGYVLWSPLVLWGIEGPLEERS